MKFTIYTKNNCNYCIKTKTLIVSKGHLYKEYKIPDQITPEELQEKINNAGFDRKIQTVPQIFHDDEYIGDYLEFCEYLNK